MAKARRYPGSISAWYLADRLGVILRAVSSNWVENEGKKRCGRGGKRDYGADI
jgi:hypothetical protein